MADSSTTASVNPGNGGVQRLGDRERRPGVGVGVKYEDRHADGRQHRPQVRLGERPGIRAAVPERQPPGQRQDRGSSEGFVGKAARVAGPEPSDP